MSLTLLSLHAYRELVKRALAEDMGRADQRGGAIVLTSARARGALVANSALVVAGLDVAAEAFRQADAAVTVEVRWGDGSHIEPGETLALITGSARGLDRARQTALNFLRRLCGIATLTSHFVDAAAGRIAVVGIDDTADALAAYAVSCGGGINQRLSASGATRAQTATVKTSSDLDAALTAGASRVILDHFTTYDIRQAVQTIGGRATVTLAGGITLERMRELATTGAEAVSIAALVESAPISDVGFEVEPA